MPWRLVWRYLVSHPVRSGLTAASIVVATFLICVLRSFVTTLDAGVQGAASNRLIVQSAVSLFVYLPHSYQGKIESVPGVAESVKWTWFGGIYQDPSNFFAQFATEPEELMEIYPEIEVIEGSEEEFFGGRTSCLVGRGLVDRFGWTVGQRVPILGTIFPRNDGSAWEFEVAGIYRSTSNSVDENTLFFHHDYLTETVDAGAAQGADGTGVFVLAVEPGAEPTRVMADVDTLFENGPQVVQTTTEAEFNRQFVSMLGSVPTLLGSIGAGVLFAILLAALNTMVMAGRERTRDLGILKSLGFSDGTASLLLVLEGVVLCTGGGVLGVGLATLAEPGLRAVLTQMSPGFELPLDVKLLALGLSLAVGLVSGLVPAWQALRLNPVDALRSEG